MTLFWWLDYCSYSSWWILHYCGLFGKKIPGFITDKSSNLKEEKYDNRHSHHRSLVLARIVQRPLLTASLTTFTGAAMCTYGEVCTGLEVFFTLVAAIYLVVGFIFGIFVTMGPTPEKSSVIDVSLALLLCTLVAPAAMLIGYGWRKWKNR